ncbi:hypothetical protein NDU88_000838 [Pleurodeles waltl]|uniref:Secreted protein n=1 Tax=Pleurodeles waltl TaxID=8319 RepID=A0AAV7MT05_PLEWA|nr:hypothetical protein NDU88_000838 [Pleurodeles waltl]
MFLCVAWTPLLLHLLFRPLVGLSRVVPYVLRKPAQALVTALALSGAVGVWGLRCWRGSRGTCAVDWVADLRSGALENSKPLQASHLVCSVA